MNTIDERVVEMRFENKDFEKNVSTSLGTIEKLKKSLDFGDSVKSVDSLQKSLGHFSFDSIGNAVSDIASKVSAGGALALGVITKIGSSLVDNVLSNLQKISGALDLEKINAIDNMMAGWGKYAEKTTGVATIIAATGESIEVVNQQLEKLNYFTDETSYGFTDMVNNIGKFTSNGIALEDAAVAMEGISTWAALSGQNAQTAERAMYNLAQAIGMGALKLADWKSIELANMGTKEFKETALETAVSLGKLTKEGENLYKTLDGKTTVSVENFRESLKDGWLDSETLMATLKEYGKAAELINDIHEETGLYAAEIFDLVDAAKNGALSIEDLEDALRAQGIELDNNGGQLDAVLEKVQLLASAEYDFSVKAYKAAQEAKTFGDAMSAVADAVSTGWMTTFEQLFGNYEQARVLWTDLANNLIEIFGAGNDARNELLKAANKSGYDDLIEQVEKAGYTVEEFETALRKIVGSNYEATIKKQYGSWAEYFETIDTGAELAKAALMTLKHWTDEEINTDTYHGAPDYTGVEKLIDEEYLLNLNRQRFQANFHEGLMNIGATAVMVANQIRGVMREIFPPTTVDELVNFARHFREVTGNIRLTIGESETLKNVIAALIGPFAALKELAVPVFELLALVVSDLTKGIVALINPVGAFVRKLADAEAELSPFEEALKTIGQIGYEGFTLLVDVLKELWSILKDKVVSGFGKTLSGWKKNLDEFSAKHLKELTDYLEKLRSIDAKQLVEDLSKEFDNLKEKIKEFFGVTDGKKFNLSEVFKNAGLEKFASYIEKAEQKLKELKRTISSIASENGISKVSAAFKVLGDELKKAFDNLKTFSLSDFFRDKGFTDVADKIQKVTKYIDEFKQKVKDLVSSESISTFAATIRTAVDEIKNKFQEMGISAENAQSGFDMLVSAITWVKNTGLAKLSEIGTAISNFFTGHGTDIATILTSGGVLFAITKLIELLTQLAEIKKLQLGTLPQTVQPVVEAFTLLKKIGNAAIIVSFVVAVKEFAIGLSELGKLDLKGAATALGTLAGAMVVLLVVFKAMKKIATVSVDSKNTLKMVSSMTGLILACIALQQFVKVLDGYKDFKVGNIQNAVKILSILGLAITSLNSVARTAGKFNFKLSNGLGLIAATIAFREFGKVLTSYQKLEIESSSVLKILGTLLLAVVNLGLISTAAGRSRFNLSAGLGLIAAAYAMLEFGKVVQLFGKMDTGSLIQGGIAATILFGIYGVVVENLAKESKGLKLTSALGTFAIITGSLIGMLGFAAVVLMFGKMDTGQLLQGGAAATILFGIAETLLENIINVTKGLKIGSAIGTTLMLVAFAAVLIVFAGAIAALGAMPLETLAKSIIPMVEIIGLFVAIGFVLKQASGIKMVALAATLIGGAIALGMLVEQLKELTSIKFDDVKGGLLALGALLGEFVALGALLYIPFAPIAAIGAIAVLINLAKALEPLITELGTLAKMDSKNAEQGIINIQSLIDILVGLAEKLIGNVTLYDEGVKAAELAKTFGESLKPLCDDTAILGNSDPEAAKANVSTVDALIDTIFALADKLKSGTATLEEALGAAEVAKTFGESLRPLSDDTAILGDSDPETALQAITVVDGLIDEMLSLADKLKTQQVTFEEASTASQVAAAFGTGLADLSKDVVTLGSTGDAETALSAVTVIDGLIDEMLLLAQKLEDQAVTLEDATTASGVAQSFGKGLQDLCKDVSILGEVDAETATTNLETVSSVISLMYGIASDLAKEGGGDLYEAGVDTAVLVRKFGVSLLPLIGDAFLTKFIDAKQSADGFKAVSELIDFMLDLAQNKLNNPELFEAADEVAKSCLQFGTSLALLVAESFVTQFVDAKKSGDGFAAVTGIVDFFLTTAEKFEKDEKLFTAATSTAEACKLFGDALAKLVLSEFISQFVDAEAASESLEVTKDVVGLLLIMARAFSNDEAMFKAAKNAADACGTFAGALKDITKANKRIAKTDAEATLEGLGPIKEIINMLVSLANEFLDSTFESRMTSGVEAIGTFTSKIGELAESMDSLISGGFLGIGGVNTAPVVAMFTEIANGISTLAQADTQLTNAIATFDKISEFVNSFGVDTTGAAGLTSVAADLGVLKDALNDLSSVALESEDIIDYTEAVKELAGLSSSLTEASFEILSVIETLGLDIIGTLSAAIGDNLSDVCDAFMDVMEAGYDVVESFNTDFERVGGEIAQSLCAGIDSGQGNAKTSGTNLARYAYEGANSLVSSFRTIGYNMGLQLASGLSSSYYSAYNAGTSVSISAYNGANYYTGQFYNIGYNMAVGMANGIYAGRSIVTTAAQSVAQSAYNAAQATLQIQSPSRVFMRLGEYVALGLANGITNGSRDVSAATEYIAHNAIMMANQVCQAVEDASAAPVITPVLDLTNVRRQVSSLSGLMGTGRSYGLSGQISSALLENQNAGIAQQIVSLDADTLAALEASGAQQVAVSVDFQGSLAQLASILQPAIAAETKRVGINLVNE